MKKILFATKNLSKVKEVKRIFAHLDYEIISLNEINDIDEVIENGFSFRENAYLKAKYYFDKYNVPSFSDDSGISITYLNDNPGIHSARFLGGKDYNRTNNFILDLMKDIEDRSAYYTCAICYVDENGPLYFDGVMDGEIANEARGENGFGFDPIFYLPEYDKNVAELSDEEKNNISHRSIALRKMVNYFEK